MMLPRTEAELRTFVREACQRYATLTTGGNQPSLRDRHSALAVQHDALVAMRRLLKRKGLSHSQIETEVLALQS